MHDTELLPPLERIHENESTRALLEATPILDFCRPEYKRFRSWFTRPLLTRPAILDATQTRTLNSDLPALLQLLQSLPGRLFDGDQQAFAAAIGWSQASSTALEFLTGSPTGVGRADLVNTKEGFKVVEFNTSSSLGAFEFGELCRAVLKDPAFGPEARRQQLTFVDPMKKLTDFLRSDSPRPGAKHLVVALIKWVSSPFAVDASLFVDLLRDLGFTVLEGLIDDLEIRPNGVFLKGSRVDIIYRTFLLKTVVEDPRADIILRPLADAVQAGLVSLFAPLNVDLFGSKMCLSLLSDDENRHLFSSSELALIDRLVPWTRSMEGADERPHAQGGSLKEYVLKNRKQLVLKPSVGHAGKGIAAGWLMTQREWEVLVDEIAGRHYIVQHLVNSVAERFLIPSEVDCGDIMAGCFLHWGMFVTPSGLSGGFVKGLPNHAQDIRFLGDGSHVGCVFHSPF